MWAPLVLCLVVGLASAEYGWKAGTQYTYELRGRTLTGLSQAADQYSGVNVRAKLQIQAKSDDVLTLQVHGAEFAEIHSNLSSGWASDIPDDSLHYSELKMENKPFEVIFQNGVVDRMVINKETPVWERNMLRAIVSLLQVDVNGENLKNSKYNLLPSGENFFGSYKTMEDSVHGKYETIYDISELPEYIMASRPEMVPLPKLRGSGKFIDIVKTRNFSNSDQHMVYHHSMNGAGNWEPASNSMGDFLSRSSISRIILSGTSSRYVIQSSVTTEKIVVAPQMYNKQKGLVASRMNLTLENVGPAPGPAPQVENPMELKDLVYEYQAPSGNQVPGSQEKVASYTSAESESESDSVENYLIASSRKKSPVRMITKDSIMESSHKSSESSESSSSSSQSSESLNSSEEYYQQMSSLDQAPQASFLAFHVGYKGKLIQESKDFNAEERAIQISREIASEIQTPGRITGAGTLSKYVILTRLIRTMSANQQKQVGERLYKTQSQASSSPEESKDYQAWAAYRDAVAQAGTGPALLTIREWIKDKKVQGEEAGQLVAVLANSARLPTPDFMEAFFEMVKDSQVENEKRLNTTAVLSFANLIRKSLVDKKNMHSRYPVHMYGPTNAQQDDALEKYVKYFDEKLHKSLEEGDSVKAQTYITALGNIAHPAILSSYEPYLEGQKQSSNYQRLVMIAAMDKMTKTYPELARAILYRVYQNIGESPEIRTAAVMQLMKTKPPAQMLQQMAQQTNSDVSKQVNAAVKSAIESAARQPINKYNRLSVENAKSAVDFLTPENFGLHSSKNFIYSYLVKEQNTGYKQQLSYIDSRDSFLPKSLSYILNRNLGGYKQDSHEIKFMASSVDQLIEQLSVEIYQPFSSEGRNKQRSSRSQKSSSWSSERAYEYLGFRAPKLEPLEGSIQISALGGEWYLPFDNQTIQQLPQIAQEIASYIQGGKSFNFTKYYNQYSYELAFSTAMGLPFTYSMDAPTVVSLSSSFTASLQRQNKQQNQKQQYQKRTSIPEKLLLDGAYDIVYSTKQQGQMGFIAPFNSKVYISGLDRNIEVRIPLKASTGYDMKNKSVGITIEPLRKGENEKILEFSSEAYTTAHDVFDLKPPKNMEATKQISATKPYSYNETIGEFTTGFAFDISSEGHGNPLDFAKIYEQFNHHDPISFFLLGDLEDAIDSCNMTVTYNPMKSSTEKMTLAFQYTSEGEASGRRSMNKHQRGSKSQENLALLSSSGERGKSHQELLKNVLSGMKSAEARAVEIAVVFEGQQSREYTLSAAYASSPVSPDARLLAYFKNSTSPPQLTRAQIGLQQEKPSPSLEVGLQLDMSYPKVPQVNFKEAMKADPSSKISGRVDFVGEKGESFITLEGILSSSPERREYIRSHPLAKLCERQMEQGLKVQDACNNVTNRANYLDTYNFTLAYSNLPEQVQNFSQKVYGAARDYGYWYSNESISNLSKLQNQVEMKVNISRGLRQMNVSIETPTLQSTFENVPLNEWARSALAIHPSYNMVERLSRRIFKGQYSPMCTVDGDYIRTFDNKSYHLGEKEGILVQSFYSSSRNAPHGNYNFTIAISQKSGDQMEMVIAVEENVLRIHPSGSKSVSFAFNERNIPVTQDAVVPLSDASGKKIMEIWHTSEVQYTVHSGEVGFQLILSGSAVAIKLDSSLRGKVRGLCGNFDGEMYNEFITPAGYMVNSSSAFVGSYSLTKDFTTPQSLGYPGFTEEIIMGDVISEADKKMGKSSKWSQKSDIKTKDAKEIEENFITGYRVKVIQETTKTCFSLKPQMLCGTKSKASRLITKVVDFHCVTRSIASKHWEKMVEKGATPDFTQKGSNYRATLQVPEKCISL